MALDPKLLAMVKGAKNKYARNNANVVKLKEGKTQVRVLQKDPTAKFWEDRAVHWIKDDPKGKPLAVTGCHEHAKGEPCKVCNAIEIAVKGIVDDDTLKIVKDWKAKKAVIVAALIRSGSDASEDPQILELTPTTFGTMLSMMEEYAGHYGNIFDPDKGMDFIIERTGKGLDTKYTVLPLPTAKPVPKGVLDRLPDLAAFIEKEDFRGEENKALRAIGSFTGVSVTGIAGPSATAGVLTGPSAAVSDSVIEEAVVEALEAAAPSVAPAATPVAAAPVAAAPAAAAPVAAKPAAAPAAAKPAAAPAALTPADFGASISQEDIDSVLAELDA